MTISAADRVAITDVIALHGFLMDDGELERLDELFTTDVEYDLSDFGLGTLRGASAIVRRRWRWGRPIRWGTTSPT